MKPKRRRLPLVISRRPERRQMFEVGQKVKFFRDGQAMTGTLGYFGLPCLVKSGRRDFWIFPHELLPVTEDAAADPAAEQAV